MSLPTAHNYVIETFMENLSSIEKNFLKPNLLLKHLIKTEKVLSEVTEVLGKKEFSEEVLKTKKDTIVLLVKKLAQLEKASQDKLSWARNFSDYLQSNTNTK